MLVFQKFYKTDFKLTRENELNQLISKIRFLQRN